MMNPSTTTSRPSWLSIATAGLAVATVVLGGLGLYFDATFTGNWADLVFDAAALLTLAEPTPAPTHPLFGAARLLSVLFAGTAASAIIYGLSRTLRTRHALWRIRRRSLNAPQDAHAVVLGSGPLVRPLIDDLRSGPVPRDVIATDLEPPEGMRAQLEAQGAVALVGDTREVDLRQRLHLGEAREVFLTHPSDAFNLDVAGDIQRDVASGRVQRPDGNALQCYVHVSNPTYAGLFRMHDPFQTSQDAVAFHVFNARERAARQLLLDPTKGLATEYAPGADAVAHYVLLGFGAAGQAVALAAARLAHFAGQHRLRMTIVDDFYEDHGGVTPALEARRQFLARYPAFCPEPGTLNLAEHARRSDLETKDAWACRDYRPACRHVRREEPAIEYVVNAEFIDLPAEDPDLVRMLLDRFTEKDDRSVAPALIACFDDDGRSFQAAHRLQALLDAEWPRAAHGDDGAEAGAPPAAFPTYVYLPTEAGLAELTMQTRASRFPMHAFGSQDSVARYAQITRPKIQTLARKIHEHYNTYSDEPTSWADLGSKYRLSNEEAAAHAAIKLRLAGYRWDPFGSAAEAGIPAAEIDLQPVANTLARMEHNRFGAARLLSGWRYEAVPAGYEALSQNEKKAVRKAMGERNRRPSLAPFDVLLPEDRPKDREQVDVLPQLLETMGEHLEPIEPKEEIGAGARRVPDTDAETPPLAETTDGSRVRRSNEGQD